MKTFILTLTGILWSAQLLFAQRENANLLVQSPDGRTVKLAWFFKSWNSDITGFDIKRKDGLQDWVKLNSQPILPEVSVKKNLFIVDADENEEKELMAKLYKLLAEHKITETDNSAYLQQLNSDPKAVQEISAIASRDYDVALITGFAYVDHSVTKKTDYQYGLFIQGTDILLDSVIWNYGQIPDLNAVKEITSKAAIPSRGIVLLWKADINKMKDGYVAGFNIYREGIRLNATPVIAADSKDPCEFMWYDAFANSSNMAQYSISAESIFGVEGIIKAYTYNPADHPGEYKKAEVTEVMSLGYYFKDGISVQWKFPQEYERFLKGFYVEKNNMPEGYKQVSPLLAPFTRSYTDKSSSPVSGYISFRVTAVYDDRTTTPGTERLYHYFPMRPPPPPQHLTANNTPGDKKNTFALSWDPPMNGDTLSDAYSVYMASPPGNDFEQAGANTRANNYTHLMRRGIGGLYRFYVAAIGKNNAVSDNSDTVAVFAPSIELPAPVISKTILDSGKVIIQWQYPNIADVRGFRLLQNKHVIATENDLNKNAREFITPKQAPGTTCDLTIIAIAENGVESENAVMVSVTIPSEAPKK